MRFAMPGAVLAGGASRRMGRSKAALPYGPGTLLEHQVSRLGSVFRSVWVVAKESPEIPLAGARLLLDRTSERAAIHGVVRALEECDDRVFVLAVDLPLVADEVLCAIARRGLETAAPALVPESDGRLEPLAAVWTRRALVPARERIARGELALAGLAAEIGAEILSEPDWRRFDPSGNSFANLNTLEDYLALRDRA
jgi:molybdopterin-guanine dinucleotide biosynthesis protein A